MLVKGKFRGNSGGVRSDVDVQIVRHTWVYVQDFGWLSLLAT